jgi:DNA-binding HxlR family transcriptional regulator
MNITPVTETCVLDANCPTLKVLDLIANKWTVLVIYALSRGTVRNGELRKAIIGISQKMLTQTLRRLEIDGIVSRLAYPTVPPRVEYSLTPLGHTLVSAIVAICDWGRQHFEEIEKARAEYANMAKGSF